MTRVIAVGAKASPDRTPTGVRIDPAALGATPLPPAIASASSDALDVEW